MIEKTLNLGKHGENDVKIIRLPVSDWQHLYPAGRIELVHQRNGDEAPYIARTTVEDGWCVWIVSAADVGAVGTGQAELRCYDGEKIAKSRTYTTITLPSIGEAEEPPEAMESWVDAVIEAKRAIVDMTVSAEKLPAAAEPTVTKTEDGVIHLHFGIPAGGGGEGGKTYTFSIEGHTITITDTDGNRQTIDLPVDWTEDQIRDIITGYNYSTFDGRYESLSGKPELFDGDYNSLQNKPNLFSGRYEDLSGKPTIPRAYDDTAIRQDIAGKYTKPTTGIPKTDLSSAVQGSLNKADSALQSIPEEYAKKSDIPTDTHINGLIDAKLTPLESLADEILEVM